MLLDPVFPRYHLSYHHRNQTTITPTDKLDMFIKKIPSWENPEILINVC